MQLDCHDAGEDSSHSQLVFPCVCFGLCFERLCIFVQATHTGICPRCAVPPTVWSSGATPCQSLQCCLLDLYIYIYIYIYTCVQLIKDTFLHVPILYLITTYSKSQFCTFYASCADSLAESCQGMGCQPQQRWPEPKGVCAPGAGSWMVHGFSMN